MTNQEAEAKRGKLLNLGTGSKLYVSYDSNSAKRHGEIGLFSIIKHIERRKFENESDLTCFDLFRDSSCKVLLDNSYPVHARITIPVSPNLQLGVVADLGYGPEPFSAEATPDLDDFIKVLEKKNYLLSNNLYRDMQDAYEELRNKF